MKNKIKILTRFFAVILISTILSYEILYAQLVRESDPALDKIDVEEHLGELIPLDLKFINDQGKDVVLKDYFSNDKPVIIVMAYYECPMLCNLVLNGLSAGIQNLGWKPGEKYRIITVSFDPTETVELASAKKKNYMASIESTESTDSENISGWDFLIGEESQSKALADALGFRYYYDDQQEQFAHPAVLFVLSPDGKISRYLYGIDFPEKNLKLAVLEASEGKVGSTIDRIMLYCFHYDPDAGGYVVLAGNVMKLGGVVTLVLLFTFIGIMWGREHYKNNLTHKQKAGA